MAEIKKCSFSEMGDKHKRSHSITCSFFLNIDIIVTVTLILNYFITVTYNRLAMFTIFGRFLIPSTFVVIYSAEPGVNKIRATGRK